MQLKHLLPTGRAWQATVDKALTRLIAGVNAVLDAVADFIARIYLDRFPATTRFLRESETMLGIPHQGATAERRERLDAAWTRSGGQSVVFLQAQLRAAGFDVYVYPSYYRYYPARDTEIGGPASEIGNTASEIGGADRNRRPIIEDPGVWLREGTGETWLTVAGEPESVAGNSSAVAGARGTERGYLLTNRTGAGDADWEITTDPTKFAYFMYVGGPSFGELAEVPTGRQAALEELILKLKPAYLHAGVFVRYV